MLRKILTTVALIATTSTAMAADFNVYKYNDGNKFINMVGGIEEGDDAKLSYIINQNPDAKIIQLDSPGGLSIIGWKLAGIIRDNKLDTAVGPDTTCASACVFALMGGVKRYNHTTSRIGIHPATMPTVDTDLTINQIFDIGQSLGTSTIRNFASFADNGREWDMVQFIDDVFSKTSAKDMYWATTNELLKSNITHQSY